MSERTVLACIVIGLGARGEGGEGLLLAAGC